MREVTVKGAGDAELAGEKHEGAEHAGLPVDAGPKNAQAHEVDSEEEDAREG
jgi:hypothetical protein